MSSGQKIVLSKPTLIFRPPSYVERINLDDLFPIRRPLEVELGSGDGSFIVEWARRNPDKNFIAVERLLGRLRKVDRKGLCADLPNLRVIRLEASYLTEYLLPSSVVAAFHIYFPDPWPKRKHHRRRLITAPFVNVVKQILVPGGAIYLRTDNEDYYTQITDIFRSNPNFQARETPSALAQLLTDFEQDYATRGVRTLRVAYQRV
ncbi:MAG: tRNA (guanosine(46)-N7)-methyltransferase TrmB [Verrucomicrobia bacterium]|nr:MAG: tRNA (guanosine(46)-N7)-methyltransferase TrmB [Verrucomicrobiota bacterium]